MVRFMFVAVFVIALFCVTPEKAQAANGKFVRGQPLRNVARVVTGSNRRASGRALLGNRPLRKVARFVLGANRGRSCR